MCSQQILLLVLLNLLFHQFILSQDSIKLKNPSFEGAPMQGGQYSFNLPGWSDCGKIYFPDDSPPDMHGMNTGFWNVNMMPHQGKTFLGLVTRFDDSFESVSQQLSTPLKAGHCYTLRAYIFQSNTYQSRTRRSS